MNFNLDFVFVNELICLLNFLCCCKLFLYIVYFKYNINFVSIVLNLLVISINFCCLLWIELDVIGIWVLLMCWLWIGVVVMNFLLVGVLLIRMLVLRNSDMDFVYNNLFFYVRFGEIMDFYVDIDFLIRIFESRVCVNLWSL